MMRHLPPAMTVACLLAFVTCHAAADSPMYREAILDYRSELRESIEVSLNGAFEHQFRSSIDRGGRLAVSRFNVSVAGIAPITPDFDIAFNAGYEFNHYSFRAGPTALGGLMNPWDNIHSVNLGATLIYALGADWTIFGGPVFQFSGESSAKASDSFLGGGIIGVVWNASPDFTIGGGAGIVSQIKDSIRVFPVVKIDWQFNDWLRLAARTHHTASGDIAGEIIYDPGHGWEAAVGATYRFRRFRLDKDGDIPEGIGQEQYLPLYGRFTYHFTPDFSATLYGGVSLAGELKLEDRNGRHISRADYDPAGVIGVNLTIRF